MFQAQTDTLLARAVYATGVPFSLFEHPLWEELFHKLRPAYKLPTRKVLSTTLLEKEFLLVKEQIEKNIESSVNLNLALDGWSNIRNEGILNFIVYTPNPYFYSFVETKRNRHTSEYLLSEIVQIIEKLGPEKFLVLISDNASNMLKCGRLLNEKYPHIIWIGCMAHTLHLIINDILKCDTANKLFNCCVEIIKTIRNSQLLTAEFKQLNIEKNIQSSLHLPVKTRWGSYLECLNSLVITKTILQTMAINEDAIKTFKNHKQTLLDDQFWSNLENFRSLLKPVVNWITYLEGDYNTIHVVHSAFLEIEKILEQFLPLTLSTTEADLIKQKFKDRRLSALKSIHLAACLLDPRSQGLIMSAEEQIESCEAIYRIGQNMNSIDDQNVMVELGMYRSREGLWGREFVWKAVENEKLSALLWWKTFYQNTELGKLAIRILSVPSTSASVERSFSTFSFIHDKKRHKLNTSRAGKLCYIAHNWKLMHRLNAPTTKKIETPKNTTGTTESATVENTATPSSSRTIDTLDVILCDSDRNNYSTTSPSSCSYTSESEYSEFEAESDIEFYGFDFDTASTVPRTSTP